MFNPRPRVEPVEVAPGQHAYVVDDFLLEPDRWVALAAEHRARFTPAPNNAFPGPELRLPDSATAHFAAFFARQMRARLGARRVERCHARLSLATQQPGELEPRQWIAHRDRLAPEPGKLTAACVLYLFHDATLGGTGFFVPRVDVRPMIHESGQLSRAEFAAKYGIAPGYLTASNAWFEKTASIAPRFNRAVFYDGGALFHTSDIAAPEKLSDDPRRGRLTLNAFFLCRANAA